MNERFTPYPLLLKPIFKPKIWGGRRMEVLGKKLPPGERIGESWELADLPDSIAGGRSVISNGPLAGLTLREAMDRHERAILGRGKRSPEGGFPLLVKYLDAQENLSVQVHPDEKYVRRHPEAHLKSEAWVVLDAEPPGLIYKGIRAGMTREEFEKHLREGGAAVLDDLIAVRAIPGDCHYLPSGTCHALGAGVMVAEVQTPSDTTFRVYDWDRPVSAGRELHIEQALECIHFGEPTIETPPRRSVRVDGFVTTPLAETEYFHIERSIAETDGSFAVVTNEMPMILMALRGGATLTWAGDQRETIPAGSTALLPAALEHCTATCRAGTDLIVITLPGPTRGLFA